MSIYNPEYNVIFIHVPKTAGTSMERREFLGGGGHRTIHEFMDLEGFDSIFKFAFVRNPWDRFASAFFHMMPNADFRAAALRPPGDIHFKPMNSFICDNDRILVDFVGKVENLGEDWAKVCEIIGVECTLPHFRKGDHRDYGMCYTSETWEAIERYYAKDIEIFNYRRSP